jgi:hypothetical protein
MEAITTSAPSIVTWTYLWPVPVLVDLTNKDDEED